MASHALRYGPYQPPRLRVGEYVTCQRRGLVRVHDWSDRGRITWPLGVVTGIPSPGAPSLILIGDLVRAVSREAASTVAQHWGVSLQLVARWRRALGVGRCTPGTRRLLAEACGRPEIARHASEGAAALRGIPESRARRDAAHARTMRAKPDIRQQMTALARRRWPKE